MSNLFPRDKLVLCFNFSYPKIVYFICHWKKFFLYSSLELWKKVLGFFCCCLLLLCSNGSLYIFFSISRLVLRRYDLKNLLDRCGKAYIIFFKNMEGAVFLSTQCMNMMLLKIFNWYIIAEIFCSLKISIVYTNLFLLKIICIACFCWLLIFLRFVLQVLPQAILA